MNLDRRGQLRAKLYDWHNSWLLRSQSRDIAFWLRMIRPSQRVVVMGAGTGRIAVPLARAGNKVIAVDRDPFRLARIPVDRNLSVVRADFLRISHLGSADHVIFPYNSLQLLTPIKVQRVLQLVAAQLMPTGLLWVDISTRFARRQDRPWQTILEAPCSELEGPIIERQRGVRCGDHYRIDTKFFCPGTTPVRSTERWYFLRHAFLKKAFARSCLSVRYCRRGYGANEAPHRRIYKLRALCRPPG